MQTDAITIPEGYKQTEIGVIPVDWDIKRLGDIGDSIIGLTYSPNDVAEYGKLVHRSSNIQNNQLSYKDNVFVNKDISEKLILRENDILVCVRNGSRDLIGKSALIKGKAVGETFGAFMSVFRTNKCQKFVYYLFLSNVIQRQINQSLGATINQITNRTLEDFQIPYPKNPDEQIVIADILSDVNDFTQKLEGLIEKKKSIKQGTMQELLTGKRRLSGFRGEWEKKRLGDLLDYEQPTKYLVKSTDYNDSHDIPVLTAGKTFVLGYTDEEFGVFKKLPTIIFDDFTTAIKYVDFPFKAKSSAMKMLIPKNKNVNLRFLFSKMHLLDFKLGDHKRYWISEYQNIEINTPKPEEQTAIAIVLSEMDIEIRELESELTKYKDIKQGMMQALLTGKIRLIK